MDQEKTNLRRQVILPRTFDLSTVYILNAFSQISSGAVHWEEDDD